MPFIENVSLLDVKNGKHKGTDVLIRIRDLGEKFPPISKKFKEVHCFNFSSDDYQDLQYSKNPNPMTSDDADAIVKILMGAFDNGLNVTVHCEYGEFRSGTVAQFGEVIGFEMIKEKTEFISLIFDKLMMALERDLPNEE